ATGSMVEMVMESINLIGTQIEYTPSVVNGRFIKPIDDKMLFKLCEDHENIVTIEEGSIEGGFGSAIGNFMLDNKLINKLYRLGVPDQYIHHGTREELLRDIGLTSSNIISILKENSLLYA
ncbi:uncharacterized protein METZ01_LOCUS453291, partial [marine metagenome]